MFLGNNGERGKGEKDRERGERKKRGDKAWRQRRAESCTRANPVYLARNFQSQLSQEKGPRAMKSCSAGTHLAQFKLPCGISLLAIRSLFLSLSLSLSLSLPPPCESADSFLQPSHRFRNSNEWPLRILITLISREAVRTAVTFGDSHLEHRALCHSGVESLLPAFHFLPSSVDRSPVKSNHTLRSRNDPRLQLYRDIK